MKVAYLIELDAFNDSGVLKKITSQVKIWNKLGVNGQLFLVSKPPGDKKNLVSYLDERFTHVYYSKWINLFYNLTGRKHVYLNKIVTSLSVFSAIKKFSPDVIYYRFGSWFPGQVLRFSDFPLVVEINSNDIEEAKSYSCIAQQLHLKSRHFLMNRANSFCAVTHELAKTIIPDTSPVAIIANGVDLTCVKVITRKRGLRQQIIFVGNSVCSWHGVEKIVYLASKLTQFDFHIVGNNLNSYDDHASNLIFHDFMDSEELSSLYSKMNVAIGTLSLHKKKMNEASALKVREYVAYELPVILGYVDTDLDGSEYILNIGNYDDNVKDHVNEIEEFIDYWGNRAIKPELDCIDMNNKERRRLNFFKKQVV